MATSGRMWMPALFTVLVVAIVAIIVSLVLPPWKRYRAELALQEFRARLKVPGWAIQRVGDRVLAGNPGRGLAPLHPKDAALIDARAVLDTFASPFPALREPHRVGPLALFVLDDERDAQRCSVTDLDPAADVFCYRHVPEAGRRIVAWGFASESPRERGTMNADGKGATARDTEPELDTGEPLDVVLMGTRADRVSIVVWEG